MVGPRKADPPSAITIKGGPVHERRPGSRAASKANVRSAVTGRGEGRTTIEDKPRGGYRPACGTSRPAGGQRVGQPPPYPPRPTITAAAWRASTSLIRRRLPRAAESMCCIGLSNGTVALMSPHPLSPNPQDNTSRSALGKKLYCFPRLCPAPAHTPSESVGLRLLAVAGANVLRNAFFGAADIAMVASPPHRIEGVVRRG